jgi:hypothetical protein
LQKKILSARRGSAFCGSAVRHEKKGSDSCLEVDVKKARKDISHTPRIHFLLKEHRIATRIEIKRRNKAFSSHKKIFVLYCVELLHTLTSFHTLFTSTA